jgi:hypothetical protein
VITLVKLLLLGAAFHGILPPWETVLLAFVIASIGAHAPKKIRHRLLYCLRQAGSVMLTTGQYAKGETRS